MYKKRNQRSLIFCSIWLLIPKRFSGMRYLSPRLRFFTESKEAPVKSTNPEMLVDFSMTSTIAKAILIVCIPRYFVRKTSETNHEPKLFRNGTKHHNPVRIDAFEAIKTFQICICGPGSMQWCHVEIFLVLLGSPFPQNLCEQGLRWRDRREEQLLDDKVRFLDVAKNKKKYASLFFRSILAIFAIVRWQVQNSL